jgi:6-phosphogluconolactonase
VIDWRAAVTGILRDMTLTRWVSALGLLLALGCAAPAGRRDLPAAGATAADTNDRAFVYVGLAGGELALFHLDAAAGTLSRRGTVSAGRAPSSLCRSVERETLVALDEATGQAASFSINAKSGALTPVGRAATGGAPSQGATLDDTGKYVIAALPRAGRVSVTAITSNGGLAPIDTFAAGVGAHAVGIHPSLQVVFVSNFRAGTVSQYTFNVGTGMLTPKPGPPLALPTGSGPTRLVSHPSGRWVYLLDEGTDSIAVHAFDEDVKSLSPISLQLVSTLPEGGARGKSRPNDLVVSPTGRFLYATNRGPDDVAAFAIGPGGTLEPVGREPSGGRAPGALTVDPSGRILLVANEGGKSLAVFHIDPGTGALGGRRLVSLAGAPLSVLAVRP